MTRILIITNFILGSVWTFGQTELSNKINALLLIGSWHPDRQIVDLRSDADSLILSKNDTTISWGDIKFQKKGKMKQWTCLSKCRRQKGGYVTTSKSEWVKFGNWSFKDASLTITFGKTTAKLKEIFYTDNKIIFLLTDFTLDN